MVSSTSAKWAALTPPSPRRNAWSSIRRDGAVKGVVGNVAPHLMKNDGEPKPPKIHDLFIDIGVSSRKEAQKLVRVGDPITLAAEFDILRGDLAVARAFDNSIGTFAVAETLRLLKESKVKLNAEVAPSRTCRRKSGCSARGRSPIRSSRIWRWSWT